MGESKELLSNFMALKKKMRKAWRKEREHGRTSKVNKFGLSLLELLGLAKHSKVFETGGLVREKQVGFKSLNRNSVHGL